MKKIGLLLVALFIATPALAVDHWQTRNAIVNYHRSTAGTVANMMVGDSITEGFWWNAVGGCRMINAGFGGASAGDLIPYVPTLSAGTPRYVVIMLGTNTAKPVMTDNDVVQFGVDLQTIINAYKAKGAIVLLASVPPIEPGKGLSGIRSQESANKLNKVIVSKASAQGLRLINNNTSFMVGGVGKAGYTVDGVHFTAASYVTFYNAVNAALTAEKARTGKAC